MYNQLKRLKLWYRRYYKTVVFKADDNDQVIIVAHFDDTHRHYRHLDGWDREMCQLNEHGTFSAKIRKQINSPFKYSCAIFSSRSMYR